nr:hypothetical protein [Nitrospirota bacterium]
MASYSEIESVSASRQFLAFSEAFLDAAARLCRGLARSSKKSSYAQGTVVLDLMFHSLELFLKAAILEKEPTKQLGELTRHDVERLSKRYANLYPGKNYAFEMPFIGADLSAIVIDPPLDEKAMLFIKEHKKNNPTDQIHRYPINKQGKPWAISYGFGPYGCLKIINQLKKDIKRLKKIVFLANPSIPLNAARQSRAAFSEFKR